MLFHSASDKSVGYLFLMRARGAKYPPRTTFRTASPRRWVNREIRSMNDAARRVFLIRSIRTWMMGGALRIEGQNVPDLEQMDVN
jgi:hypothetical protein